MRLLILLLIASNSSETMSDVIVYPNPHTGEFSIQGL